MNQELVKFIELCLVDGVISDKEREVIFRKSKELGVPKDECEIILESMTFKKNDNKKDSNNTEESIDETSQNEIKVNNEKDSKNNTNENQNQGKVTILKKSDYGGSTQSQEEIKLQRIIMDFYNQGKVGEEEKKIIYEKSKELGVSKEICDDIMNTVSSIYDPEPEPIKKEYEDGVEKNGLFIIKDEGEGRKWEQFYKGGLKHGLGKFYNENGKLSLETNYVMGKKDGLEKSYLNILGRHFLYSEIQFKDGKKNGVEKVYSENGQLQSETYYKDGKETTEKKEFVDNEKKESEIIPKDIIKKNTNNNPKSKTTEDIQHTHPSNEHTNIKRNDKNKESGKVDFSNFISVHSSKKGVFGRIFILDLKKTFKSINNKWYVEDKVREVIEPIKDKIIFKFSHSFVVGEDFLISVESGKKVPLLKVNDLELKDGKTFSKSGFFLDDEWFGDFPSMDNEGGKELFYLFKKYINENLENDKSTNENNNQESDNEKDLIIDDKKNNELEKQDPDDINWESLNISRNLFDFIEVYTLSGRKPSKSELKSIFDISDREGIQREEILVIIEKMINLGKHKFEKKLEEKIQVREEKKQDFFKLITIENITDKKSKFYEVLDSEQFELQKKFNDGLLRYKLDVIKNGVNDSYNVNFFNLLKLEVFNKIFKKKFFCPIMLSTINQVILNKFYYNLRSIHGDDFGNYTDKNEFIFNPVTGCLVFYIDNNNIFKYELEEVKSLSSLPFNKGGLLTKPGIILNGRGHKDGLQINIKSKFFKETEEIYSNWVKFLLTLEDFKKDLSKLRKQELILKTNDLHEYLDDRDWKWELKKYVSEVKGILNSKKKEIK